MSKVVNADADTKDSTTDVVDNDKQDTDVSGGGSDEPTYTKEAYEAVKNESIKRRKKIDTLSADNEKLSTTVQDLTGKVKKLTAIISGGKDADDDSDADVDLEKVTDEFKTGQEKVLGLMRSNLLHTAFYKSVSKMKTPFADPDFVFGTINPDDSRLEMVLETQSVTGMDDIINSLAKDKPFLLAQSKKEDDDDPADSITAPGNKTPPKQPKPDSAIKDKLKEIEKEAEKIGGLEGAKYYLDEKNKLLKK
jgi:hypothetical protein